MKTLKISGALLANLAIPVIAACGDSGDGTTADATSAATTAPDATTGAPPPTSSDATSADATSASDPTGDEATSATPTTDSSGGADTTGGGVSPTHPRIALNDEATRARLLAALEADTPAAARFKEIVDSEMAGSEHYEFQPWFAALLGELTGEAPYCAYAIAGTDAVVAAEEALIANGERAEVAGDSYLYVGDTVGNLALVYDWCFDALTDDQRQRWLTYANQAVWNVWHPAEANWGGVVYDWSGWSIDNPSNNYYYSFLQATLYLGLAAYEEHPDAAGWLTMFRETKIAGQLVPQFAADLAGGGSREGTGYGVAMARLFRLYDFWETSTGESIKDLTGHTRASLLHILHTTVPTLDRIAPVGDHARDSTAALFDYHRDYVQLLAHMYRDDPVAPTARWWLQACSVPEMSQHFMAVWDLWYGSTAPAAPESGLHSAYHASGTGQVYARSSWDTDATWVHLAAGPYTESHAHRDKGSIMFYRGEWLAYDQNILSHSGLRQEEESHNLVRIVDAGETVPQREGADPADLLALAEGDGWLYAAVDVTPIYDDHPAVDRVEREMVFIKPDVLVVFDRVDTSGASQRIWQLNTPIQPTLNGTTATITGSAATLVVRRIEPADAASSVFDWTADDDMDGGFRIDSEHADPGGSSRFLHVLSTDGAVMNAAASHAGSQLGVELTLAGNVMARVRFESDAPGGELVLDGQTLPLAPGITALPELAQ